MEDDFEMDRERIYRMRRMARKLAHNRSRERVVRKLPQTMVIVTAPRPKRVVPVRKVINGNKRLTYILLLGMTLSAYVWDLDQKTVEYVMQAVEHAVQDVGILGRT